MKTVLIVVFMLLSGCTKHVVPDEFFLDIDETLHEPERLEKLPEDASCVQVYQRLMDNSNKYSNCALRSDAVRGKTEAFKEAF